ncbi:MAG TPA: HD domain-containing phosphohydrolase [Gemmatimonadaceae bacterium]|nr:HD domain-containing phosphohydrolase [Gemmatimonadaceae bacterium]
MKPLLLTALGSPLSDAPIGRRGDDVEVRAIPTVPLPRALDLERPTVLALDRTLITSAGEGACSQLRALAGLIAIVGIGAPGETDPGDCFPIDVLTSFIPGGASTGTKLAAFRGAFRHAAALAAVRRARNAAVERTRELAELSAIGVALTTQRDLGKLLALILSHARRVTESDAGSLYLVERDEDGAPVRLRFAHSQNHSLPAVPFASYAVPIDSSSLAGYAASTGEPLVIGDVHLLPDGAAYRQNRSFDDTFGYRTKSMLVLPMKTHRDEIIGVLQLINRKRDPEVRLSSADQVECEVVPFDARCVEIATALASQAAVAIDNGRLYEDIERLFEGFVTAAVTAIESRDPATSGHSGRVASMTVTLAEKVDALGSGPYRDVSFTREQLRELRYAGLLHDFGKVGVREQVLVKEKKLYPHDLELIRHRFAFLDQRTELEFERARAELLLAGGRAAYETGLARLECERRTRREELARFLDTIVQANEPTVLAEGSFDALEAIGRRTFVDFDGHVRPLLEDHELQFLMIRRGNLDEQERREIESHVTHTYRFLEQIPWTRELRAIPQIAFAHHEKLNGRGYPNRAAGLEIPVQARIMTIADIYDALTATDRPYKRAVPRDRALDILAMEAKEGTIDPALLETFIGARVFDSATGATSRD